MPVLPRTINVKPSRFGSLRELFEGYDCCAERGIGAYGGGQSELGVGRGQIQYLASLFHPDDAERHRAVRLRRDSSPSRACPPSPLAPDLEPTGFRRRS